MISSKTIIRLSTFFAIIAWIVWVYADITILFHFRNKLTSAISDNVPVISFNLFLLLLFIFYKYRIERGDSLNFIDLLWRVFVTGLVATIISLFFRGIVLLLGDSTLTEYVIFRQFIYIINVALLSSVIISSFAVFRRLILYQKSKVLIVVWRAFQYALILSLLYNVLPWKFLDQFFNYYLFLLIITGLFLSVNMKWVAYLNFKQKWKGILLVGLSLFYLIYFVWTITVTAADFQTTRTPFTDFQENVFLVALIVFVVIYTIFSLLVLLFNLPTSSVFEQKLDEVVNYQKLSQSIQTEQSEDRVYDILLESSVSTVFADAAWLEVENGNGPEYYCYNISQEEAKEIKEGLVKNGVIGVLERGQDKTKNLNKALKSIKKTTYRSLIAAPVVVKNEQIGLLALLKEVSDGFNKEMEKIVATFANQGGISIENFRLLKEALVNERYKEELKIAKRVQDGLLPDNPHHNHDFEIVAFSKSAAEVGGDYYDTYKIDDENICVIIGDVSGKGTSAAFHMSQLKGIFQSFSQLAMEPIEFLTRSNRALSKCLDKSSFITATYFMINSRNKSIKFARAGHCPTLYYHAESNKIEYFKNKGIGLGMVRDESFANFLQESEVNYKKGDILILYTDGITEAQNLKGDEYGYDKLQDLIMNNIKLDPGVLKDKLINDLYEFTGTETINDDYTVVIIKFK